MTKPIALGLYAGVPPFARVLFYVTFIVIVFGLVWQTMLFIRGLQERRRTPSGFDEPSRRLLWAVLVPACDEEVTIADTVGRLFAFDLPHLLVIVVDDGSTDATPAILAGMSDPRLVVLRRDRPEARTGKSAALNAGWRHLHSLLRPGGAYASWDAADVVVAIVDADGRLDPRTPAAVERFFEDPRVGGVQSQVSIYNRHSALTWCQNVEFAIYGRLYQIARTGWGVPNMGGNAQFNRLAALDEIATDDGPWRLGALTEDQDLGLRLIMAGWLNRHEWRVGVDQQGLNSLKRLIRQRTRWAQGGLQCLRYMRGLVRAPVGFLARVDLLWYLTMPLQQLLVVVSLLTAIFLWIFRGAAFISGGGGVWLVVLILFLTFGEGALGMLARYDKVRLRNIPGALVLWFPYAFYTWVIVPALLRACVRQLSGQESWTKTAREPIPAETEVESPSA